jgi:hypothetical protein
MLDLKGFFDETGHPRDPKAKVFGMSGCFAAGKLWNAVEHQWVRALDTAGIEAFHASDCETGGGSFIAWPKAKRLAVYKSFAQLVARHKLTHISCVIDLLAYRRLSGEFHTTVESPYTLAFTACMIAIAREADKALFPKDEKVSCIIELQKEYRSVAEGAYYALVNLTPLGQRLMPLPVFAPKEAFVVFQAADLVSYEFGKFHLNRVHDPTRPIRKSFVKMMGETRAASYYYDEVHLRKMVGALRNGMPFEAPSLLHDRSSPG